MARLQQIVAGLKAVKRSDQHISEFLDILRESTGEMFCAMEFANGPWMKRLRRYHDGGLLLLDELGPDIGQLMRAKERTIEAIRRIFLNTGSTRHVQSDLQDSNALASLNAMIEGYDSGISNFVVRFYTETPMLLQAWAQSDRLKKLLTYKKAYDALDMPHDANFVVRDSAYFLMRATLYPLGPYSIDQDLAALRRLSFDLGELVQLSPKDLPEAVEHLHWEGRSLAEVIKDFEDLSLAKSVWTAGQLPKAFVDGLSEWAEILEFAQGQITGERLFAQIGDIERELEAKISQLRAWTHDFETIKRACDVARRQIRGVIEDPMRDLGLVRWGYTLPDSGKFELIQIIRAILSEDESEWLSECVELASRMEQARQDVTQCLVVCAVLWVLNRFGDICDLVRACGESVLRLPASLKVLRAAAQLKAGIVRDIAERTDLVNEIWELAKELNGEERQGILLGVAYILYHAWKQETMGLTLRGGSLPGYVKQWAQRSFEAGETAVQTLPTSSLAWAFAVNHCAYVGIVTGIEDTKKDPYVRELARLRGFPNFHNSRFDDTLAYYHLHRLELEILKPPSERRQDLISESLELASHYFNQARATDFGDIDLDEHISRLALVRESLRASR